MKPIHLLVVVQWRGREIAITLNRFAGSTVRSIVDEVCAGQGLLPGERWVLQFEGRPLPLDRPLGKAIPGVEARRGIVLFLHAEGDDPASAELASAKTERDVDFSVPPPPPSPPIGPPVSISDTSAVVPEPAFSGVDLEAALEEEGVSEQVVAEDQGEATVVIQAPATLAPGTPRPSMAPTGAAMPRPAPARAPLPSGEMAAARTVTMMAPVRVAPRTVERQATVRYYHRMNPENTFPLLVVLSKKMVQEVVKKAVSQASSKRFAVAADVPVEIEPVLPGCDCYPPRKLVSARPDEVSVTFWIVPRVMGKLSQPHVLIRQDGKELAEVPLQIKVVKQTATICAGVLSLLLPFATTLMQHFRLDFTSQTEDNFALYAQAANFLLRALTPEMLGGLLLVLTLGLYLMRRPRQREVFWDVQSVGPEDQLLLAKEAAEAGDVDKASRLLAAVVRAYPDYQAAWLFLGEWHHGRENHKLALEHYEKGLNLGRAEKGDYFRAALCASRLGDNHRAFALLQKAERELGPSGMSGVLWYNLACYATRLGRHEDAMGYLGRAAAAGFAKSKQFANDPDLKPLRARADFQRLLASLKE